MKRCKQALSLILLALLISAAAAGERTMPVDLYIMIDKSLSMSEMGRFDSMQAWVRDYLAKQVLIHGDTVSIYQFYGATDHLLKLTIKSEQDRQKVVQTIDTIRPDGEFTDIGLALETLKTTIDRTPPDERYTILLLLTDLHQEAPWSSRYAGVQERYESEYLAEARIVEHEAWYEITLDMGIQDRVVLTSNELFSSIIDTSGEPRTTIEPDGSIPVGDERTDAESTDVRNENGTGGQRTELSVPPHTVLLSLLILAFLASGIVLMKKKRDKREEKPEKR